jgi:osmotically-inducible protein OsmY
LPAGAIPNYDELMNIPRAFVSLALAMAVVVAACSPRDEDEARKAAQEIEDKTKEIAGDAADKAKEVASDVSDKGKEIVSSTGEAITDGWITTKLKAKFADEKLLKDSNITINTADRVVTLKGSVGTDAAKKQAVMIANGTEGVLRVVDEVVVKTQ